MAWWWIGNILLLFVVIPVVLLLANRVLRPVREIKAYADDVIDHLVVVNRELDNLPALQQTAELTNTARRSAERYAAALQQLV